MILPKRPSRQANPSLDGRCSNTALGTGFSACNCLFVSRNCLLTSLILGSYYKLKLAKKGPCSLLAPWDITLPLIRSLRTHVITTKLQIHRTAMHLDRIEGHHFIQLLFIGHQKKASDTKISITIITWTELRPSI